MIGSSTIHDIFNSFEQIKVLIIGDAMIDRYIFGDINRISPEAPIPIVDVLHQEDRLGGAANVALNVKRLGGIPILATVMGDDDTGYKFKQILQQEGISADQVILDQERKSTLKNRVISRNQQLLRFDSEQSNYIDDKTEILFLDNVIDLIYNESPAVVILQDYNKGVLSPKVIANVIHNCHQANIPIAVDPKKENFFAYKGCTLFKPNLRETLQSLQLTNTGYEFPEILIKADQYIRSQLDNTYTIITLSEKGIFVGLQDDHDKIPALTRNIVDVSGAGDTVISLLALGLALDLDIFAICELANIAAGQVCEEVGVVPLNKELLIEEAVMMLAGE